MKKNILRACALLILVMLIMPSAPALAAQASISVSPEQMSGPGQAEITVTVTNDGLLPMEGIAISGSGVTFDINQPTIQPGVTQTYTQAIDITQEQIDSTLTFSMTWTEGGVPMSKDLSVEIESSVLGVVTVTCKASKTNAKPGERITLTYIIANNSGTTASNISLTDRQIKSSPMVEGVTLSHGQSHTSSYEYTMGNSTVTSQPVLSYRLADDGSSKTYTGSALTLGMINAKLDVEVEQSDPTVDGVRFTLHITNDGNQKINNIKVTDELGVRVDDGEFSLAVGEQKTLIYTVKAENEPRYVTFEFSGSMASGAYEDKIGSFAVRPYVDPDQIKVRFDAEISSPLNAEGSMGVTFRFDNQGELTFHNITVTEELLGEVYRSDKLGAGLTEIPVTVSVEESRELKFTLSFEDYAGNPYQYAASLTAAFSGDLPLPTRTPGVELGIIGGGFGKALTNTLNTAFTVLAILTAVAAALLVAITVAERNSRKKAAQRRRRQRQEMERR